MLRATRKREFEEMEPAIRLQAAAWDFIARHQAWTEQTHSRAAQVQYRALAASFIHAPPSFEPSSDSQSFIREGWTPARWGRCSLAPCYSCKQGRLISDVRLRHCLWTELLRSGARRRGPDSASLCVHPSQVKVAQGHCIL